VLDINSIFELDEIFERFLNEMSIGLIDYSYSSFDIIIILVLWSRSHMIKENQKLLDKINTPFDKYLILKIIKSL